MGATFVAAGASQTQAKRIGDRQKTAARLLRASVERSYDAEVDIDWDEPWLDGKTFGPEHRLSLYGTRIWDKLSPEQRSDLARHEMASVLSFGILAEAGLSAVLFRKLMTGKLADDATRYLLSEIGDETRHSTMFSRMINKLDVEPYRQPKFLIRILSVGAQLIPLGASAWGGTLLIEEVLDRLQRESMISEQVQPHLRQLFKIHVLEEARHITYAREELVRSYQASNRLGKAFHRLVLAVMCAGVLPALANPQVYRRALGMSPLRGALVAQLNPNYRVRATFASEPMVRYFHEVGLITGRVTAKVWKATRALPDDLHEEIFGAPPSTSGSRLKRLVASAVGV
ncbi:MAG: AurF N-oxygenase family protein [Segniliparus sp.]|uniref:AurF N-oxygenase family protein n=1 Tax=Segniliparus sp. TaxID=2804064 RepID=UPI003F374069